MKCVKKTFELPDDLNKFVDQKARESKKQGEPFNFSKYIRDLIRRDRKEMEENAA